MTGIDIGDEELSDGATNPFPVGLPDRTMVTEDGDFSENPFFFLYALRRSLGVCQGDAFGFGCGLFSASCIIMESKLGLGPFEDKGLPLLVALQDGRRCDSGDTIDPGVFMQLLWAVPRDLLGVFSSWRFFDDVTCLELASAPFPLPRCRWIAFL